MAADLLRPAADGPTRCGLCDAELGPWNASPPARSVCKPCWERMDPDALRAAFQNRGMAATFLLALAFGAAFSGGSFWIGLAVAVAFALAVRFLTAWAWRFLE